MITLILDNAPSAWTHRKYRQGAETHAIDIPRRRPPLRIAVASIRNSGKATRNVVVQRRVLPEIQLVTIAMAIGARRMADFRPSCDGHITAASTFERDGTVNCAREDTFVGGAAWVGLCGTAA